MSVDSREEIDAWRNRLKEHGVGVTDVVDHGGIWYSIYFMDPNGVLLEFTYQARDLNADDASQAHAMVEEWTKTRSGTRGARSGDLTTPSPHRLPDPRSLILQLHREVMARDRHPVAQEESVRGVTLDAGVEVEGVALSFLGPRH